MKIAFKSILSIILIIALLFIPITVAANNSIQPLWDNTDSILANIAFTGTTGTYSAYITGDPDVTDIIAFAKLYYKDSGGAWVEIPMPWGFLVRSDTLFIAEDFDAQSGVEYKVELEVNVYVEYDCETIYVTTTGTCP